MKPRSSLNAAVGANANGSRSVSFELWAARVCFDFTASALEATETRADLASGHSLGVVALWMGTPTYSRSQFLLFISHSTRCEMRVFQAEEKLFCFWFI
jgi:hypothetical protein